MNPATISILVLMVTLLVYFVWRMATGRSSQTSTKDWLLYLLIAPLMIVAFVGASLYADSKGIKEETIDKWRGIFITALLVFGLTVKKFWEHRKKWIFWAEVGVLIVAHFVALQRLRWEGVEFILVIGIPEMIVLCLIFSLMLKPAR
jgi:hypothetical protein